MGIAEATGDKTGLAGTVVGGLAGAVNVGIAEATDGDKTMLDCVVSEGDALAACAMVEAGWVRQVLGGDDEEAIAAGCDREVVDPET